MTKEMNLESGCLVVVREISKKEESFCEWNSIFMDILELSFDFEHCVFSHINRMANGLTHNLAKFQYELSEYKTWRNALPPSICNPNSISTL